MGITTTLRLITPRKLAALTAAAAISVTVAGATLSSAAADTLPAQVTATATIGGVAKGPVPVKPGQPTPAPVKGQPTPAPTNPAPGKPGERPAPAPGPIQGQPIHG
jgi:hypothetical protein